MTEKELVRDILFSFKLTKACLYNLKGYEVDLICETYSKYKKDFIHKLLKKAKNNYSLLNDKEISEEFYSSKMQYEVEKLNKNKRKTIQYIF